MVDIYGSLIMLSDPRRLLPAKLMTGKLHVMRCSTHQNLLVKYLRQKDENIIVAEIL